MKKIFLLFLFCLVVLKQILLAQGTVYIVNGSDTGIWDGMNTDEYFCTYKLGLFTDPLKNTYKVMDPQFRNKLKDSYGTSMKMTWWMMAGNIFRYATNTDVPLPNTMTLYLMKKYHMDNVTALGDELSLHYHTFTWTDYDKDKKFWWNQAQNFMECYDDFNVTLAQYLLEENTFPVSFRSGWHAMDNEWQNYLDGLVPYSLHNDYPHKRFESVEPTDNIYDWSKASKEFVPYHPSLTDYQLPGNGNSWNTRSIYMGSVSQAMMDGIFAKASNGVDQVPCFWAHLPEADFPENMMRIDSLAHISAAKYPKVKFRYCTAVEAMQLWRKGNDTAAPIINIEEIPSGSNIKFRIYSNEDIFQSKPFIAVKNTYEEYSVLNCVKENNYSWVTTDAVPRSMLAKMGTAVTDKMGNLTTKFISYLPDDLFVDNNDPGCIETAGNWSSNSKTSWGTDSRQCILTADDSTSVEWAPQISRSGLFNIWIQVPAITNPAEQITFRLISSSGIKNIADLNEALRPGEWNYISTAVLLPGDRIQMTASGKDQSGKVLSSDVLKLSALVKPKAINVRDLRSQASVVSERDTVILKLTIQNQGVQTLQVKNISSAADYLSPQQQLPLEIPGMSTYNVPILFYSEASGEIQDTLLIESDDPGNPLLKVPYNISVEKYFEIVDNEDTLRFEEQGPWSTSNAQAWGSSSRYSWSGSGGSASFESVLKYLGTYEVSYIVPQTQNAVTNARYIIMEGQDTLAIHTLDQNIGSGSWTSLGSYFFSAEHPAKVLVTESAQTVQNKVLRADAVKFQITTAVSIENKTDDQLRTFALYQNYPNPFNPETKIRYCLKSASGVDLLICNSIGQIVYSISEANQSAGEHVISFDGSNLSTGIYFYSLIINNSSGRTERFTKKMLLLR